MHVESGAAPHALREVASEFGAGLIIVGSTHRGAFGRIALGSTADRVLEDAPCPVMVAPRGFRDEGGGLERIGVAFVDTPGGRSALRVGGAIAKRTGAHLSAYTVIEPHAHETDRERAEQAIAEAIDAYAGNVRAEARVLTTGGVEALVAQSRELDLLVRGCASPGPVRPPLALGLPSRLARQAACPFLIVAAGRERAMLPLFAAGQRDLVAS